jgi:hypothetical protein
VWQTVVVGCDETPQIDLETTAPPLLRWRLWPASDQRELIDLEKIGTSRDRYRGAVIP